jgi:hypothetical protein
VVNYFDFCLERVAHVSKISYQAAFRGPALHTGTVAHGHRVGITEGTELQLQRCGVFTANFNLSLKSVKTLKTNH